MADPLEAVGADAKVEIAVPAGGDVPPPVGGQIRRGGRTAVADLSENHHRGHAPQNRPAEPAVRDPLLDWVPRLPRPRLRPSYPHGGPARLPGRPAALLPTCRVDVVAESRCPVRPLLGVTVSPIGFGNAAGQRTDRSMVRTSTMPSGHRCGIRCRHRNGWRIGAAVRRTTVTTDDRRSPPPRRQRHQTAGDTRRLPAPATGAYLLRPLAGRRADHRAARPAARSRPPAREPQPGIRRWRW